MTNRTDSETIDFVTVPSLRNRRDGWTQARQRSFIATLGETGLVSHAALCVGMSAKSAYALRRRAGAESFCEAWGFALDMGLDQAVDKAILLGTKGHSMPVFYRGQQVGVRTRPDSRLLMRALTILDRRLAASTTAANIGRTTAVTRFV